MKNKELNIGDSIYKVEAAVNVEYCTLKVVAGDVKVAVKEYVLSNKYNDEFGPHEVFELLPDKKETLITGWKDSHSGMFIPYNSTEPDFSCDDFYGDEDFFELNWVMFTTNKEFAKNKIYEEIQKLVKNSEETSEMLKQIAEDICSR